MKAILLEQAGSVENFEFRDIKQPSIKENEVLIQTKSISINPVDYKIRSVEPGLNMMYGEQRPVILGWDVSGVVSSVGSSVTKFKEGDRVFGMINFPGNGSAYAEYVASPEDHLAKIPENTSFEDAAAATLAALTALQVLETRIKKGDNFNFRYKIRDKNIKTDVSIGFYIKIQKNTTTTKKQSLLYLLPFYLMLIYNFLHLQIAPN